MELAEAHHTALRVGSSDVPAAAEEFFRESLATFELATQGYRQAHETARLEQEHARRQEQLAEAALAVGGPLSVEEILAVVAEQARAILGAPLAAARLLADSDGNEPRAVAPSGAEMPSGVDHETPLLGRGGKRLGTLWVHGASERRPGVDAILVQLAQMASAAIENARRYEREKSIAQTLQSSLLPPKLPEVPGIEAAARYWAGGEGIDVGGDFYDLFRTSSGDWAVVIGDVCGKGPEAAALTSLARYTVRAGALHEPTPSRVLRLLNTAMLEQRKQGRFATVEFARLRPGKNGASLLVSSGGHPLPLLLRADGRLETVGAGGTLLGVVPEPVLVDSEIDLDPGDTIFFYTDGIIEVRAGGRELFGADDLARLLSECRGLDPESILDRVDEQVRRRTGGRPRDDVAMLALRLQG